MKIDGYFAFSLIMQYYHLILRSKVFSIPTFFPNLIDVNHDIYLNLQKNGNYFVKSNVDDNVLNYFIANWVENEIPEITNSNFSQYQQLSQEFDRMEDLLILYQNHSIKILSLSYKNRELQKHINKQSKKLTELTKSYPKIIKVLFTKINNDNFYEYFRNKDDLLDFCKSGNVDNVISILSKRITDYGCYLTFVLNEEDKTASLYQNLYWLHDINIPYSVKYKSEEYIVTNKICDYEVYFDHDSDYLVEEIQFPENSKFKEIPNFLINSYYLISLTIPSSVEKLCKGWCRSTRNLTDIKISPQNKNFIYYNDSYIIGKSDSKSDIFDVLYFSRRDIEIAKIPSFIKKIKPNAFESCKKLISIQFSEDSELISISKNAIFDSSLRNLTLPSSVEKLKSGWCLYSSDLNSINILKNQKQNISMYKNDFILGKLDKKSDVFDVLIFSRPKIKEAFIPSFIKKISSYAFFKSSLEKIEFSKESVLLSIGKFSFSLLRLENISIPSHVKYIHESAFERTSLKSIEFSKESELELIDKNAFHSTKIKSIFIPSHVKIIGEGAFKYCEELEIVEFSNDSKLKIIKENAFRKSNIDNLKIPSSLIVIDDKAFDSCSNLKRIDFSNASESLFINKNSFLNCSFDQIIIPSDLKLRGNWLGKTRSYEDIKIIERKNKLISSFENNFIIEKNDNFFDVLLFSHQNEKIEIPLFIKQIGSHSFSTSKITEIFIPSSVMIIHDYAFAFCEFLTKIEFSEKSKLKSIGKHAFNSTKIVRITIPDHVKMIDDYAFNECKELEYIQFSENSELTFIGDCAFYDTKIEHINIPSHVRKIGQKAFINCKKLQKIEFSKNSELTVLDFCLFNVESISVPDSVIIVKKNVFSYQKNVEFSNQSKLKIIEKESFNSPFLESITLPSSVVGIDDEWIWNCISRRINKLQVLQNEEKNISIYNNDFIIGKSDLNNNDDDAFDTLIFARQDIEEVIIPPFIKQIKYCAFLNCQKIKKFFISENSKLNEIFSIGYSSIESIFIPPKVTVIHPFTFNCCDQLKYVEFSSNSESLTIEKSAFNDSEIEKIKIPSNVVLKNEWCKSIYDLNDIEIIEMKDRNIVFYENNFILGKTDQSKDQFDVLLFARRGISDQCLIIPPFIQKISPYAFENCQKLNDIKINEDSKLTKIDSLSFYKSSVKKVYFSSHISEICEYAFAVAENLTKVEFPKNSNLKIIGIQSLCFSSLNEIFIPDRVIRIESEAFANSMKLKKIILSENSKLKYIGHKALLNTQIVSFSIPPHVSQIGLMAFSECKKIQIIEICENSELENFVLSHLFDPMPNIIMVPVNLDILLEY